MRFAMLDYHHMIGVELVCEMPRDEPDCVALADDDVDRYGLRFARIIYRWSDNDKALIARALEQMGRSIEAIGAHDIFEQDDDTCHPGGMVRTGSPRQQRRRCRLPPLEHSEPLGLRRVDVPDGGRREAGADDPDDCAAHGRTH